MSFTYACETFFIAYIFSISINKHHMIYSRLNIHFTTESGITVRRHQRLPVNPKKNQFYFTTLNICFLQCSCIPLIM